MTKPDFDYARMKLECNSAFIELVEWLRISRGDDDDLWTATMIGDYSKLWVDPSILPEFFKVQKVLIDVRSTKHGCTATVTYKGETVPLYGSNPKLVTQQANMAAARLLNDSLKTIR